MCVYIYCVVGANHSRFSETYEEFKSVLQSPLLAHAPIVILAHKQDLPNVASEQEVNKVGVIANHVLC